MTACMLINPKAGLLKGCKTPDEVKGQLRGLNLEPVITLGSDDAAIEAFVASVRQSKPDIVLVAGGDGTVASVMKSLIDMPVIFGVIPIGSTNNIGQSLGLTEEIERSVAVINRGKVASMDIGTVNGIIFIESVGIGLLARIMDRIGEQDSKKEVMKVLSHTLAELVTVETIPVDIIAADNRIKAETVWLTVTNTGRAAAVSVDPTSTVHDGKLELVYCEPLSLVELPAYTVAFLQDNHIEKEKFKRISGPSLEIKLSQPVPVHVDGELFEWDSIRVGVIPAALRVFIA